jgi:hypothetical protein
MKSEQMNQKTMNQELRTKNWELGTINQELIIACFVARVRMV